MTGSYLGQITSGKRVDAQNRKRPNRDINFSKSRNNWGRLNMFKAAKVERKIREINLLINMQINLSSCRTSDHYLSLSLQRLSCGLVRN